MKTSSAGQSTRNPIPKSSVDKAEAKPAPGKNMIQIKAKQGTTAPAANSAPEQLKGDRMGAKV